MQNLDTIFEFSILGFATFGLCLFFILLNWGNFYVLICKSRGFIRGLFRIAKVLVKINLQISPPYRFKLWDIEKNPPSWLTQKVITFKNKITWDDRAEFWHLLLRSGTLYMNKNIGNQFLPQLVSIGIKNIVKKFFKVLLKPIKYFKEFSKNPIKSYLNFCGGVSGETINWICSNEYFYDFVRITKKAGFPIGYYFGKKYIGLEIIDEDSDALKAMQTIMIIYVLFGLAAWEKHIYPFNEPKIIIKSKDEIIISYCGDPYKCPHRGLKHRSICQAFVSWENGLVQAVNPNLRSFVSKSLANGDQSCDVVVKFVGKRKQ
ncbi:MAG: hypothetical protein EAX96_01560 [Candidatus Lokiarchaeota archaeon]|nr:hypothetical protein [Candidatus Lokiarchaeota archaeon]